MIQWNNTNIIHAFQFIRIKLLNTAIKLSEFPVYYLFAYEIGLFNLQFYDSHLFAHNEIDQGRRIKHEMLQFPLEPRKASVYFLN